MSVARLTIYLFGVSLSLGLMAIVAGPFSLADTLTLTPGFGVGLLAIAIAAFIVGRKSLDEQLVRDVSLISAAAFLAYLASEVSSRNFIYFTGGHYTAMVLGLGFLVLGLLWLFQRYLSQRTTLAAIPISLLLAAQAFVALSFLTYVANQMVFSDDHPSFLYRLYLLQNQFPAIPFYNPEWNAGYSAREFFASGILNVFFLSWPIVAAFDFANWAESYGYNYILLWVFVIVAPWAMYAALRIVGESRRAAAIAGIFTLAPSFSYYEWLLSYGTLGFCCSVVLLPLAVALAWRVALSEKLPNIWHLLSLVIVGSLTLCWSLSFIGLLPVTLWGIARARRVFAKDRRAYTLSFVLLFALINLPWVYLFFVHSNVSSFVAVDALPGRHAAQSLSLFEQLVAITQKPFTEFQQILVKVHPALFFAAVPGVLLFAVPAVGRLFLYSAIWLLVIAWVGAYAKPQLELGRMVLPAAWLLVPLIAVLLDRLLSPGETECDRPSWRALRVALVATLVGAVAIVPFEARAYLRNERLVRYKTAPAFLPELVEALDLAGGEGRVFFTGFILHELGTSDYRTQDGGHIAPLAAFAGKEMYASDFYHTKWSTVDPIPSNYRKRGRDGIEEFLNLLNVTAVVTYKREWAAYCKENSDIYQQVLKTDRFRVFRRKSSINSFVYQGEASVEAFSSGLKVSAISQTVVLRYRYLPHLRSSDPDIELFPIEVFEQELGGGKKSSFSFIGLKNTRSPQTGAINFEITF